MRSPIYKSWKRPLVHFMVPQEQQFPGAPIQAKGYDFLYLEAIQNPGDLDVVVARDANQRGDIQCSTEWLERVTGVPVNVHIIIDRHACEDPFARPYFTAVKDAFDADPKFRRMIQRKIAEGGFFSSYECGTLTEGFATSLGFPTHQIMNWFSNPQKRLEAEVHPDGLVAANLIPEDLVLTRELAINREQADDLVKRFRAKGHLGAINMEFEARAGGNQSARLEAGEFTNVAVGAFFERMQTEMRPGENIVVDRIFPGELPWSVNYEPGEDGYRVLGMHTKLYSEVSGKHLKVGSVMGYGETLPGIPPNHIEIAGPVNGVVADAMHVERRWMGYTGVIWRFIPGVSLPKLHRLNLRNESEKPAQSLRRHFKELTGVELLAQHTRLYLNQDAEYTWELLSRLLRDEMFSTEKMEGCFFHVPYWDVGRKRQTVLLIQLGKSADGMLAARERIKKLTGALAPNELPKS